MRFGSKFLAVMVKHSVEIGLIILMIQENANLEHTQNIFSKRLEVVLDGLKQKINQWKSLKRKIQT